MVESMSKKEYLFSDIPDEVMKVYTIGHYGQPIGMELYNECQKVIDKYPQYFEWEHKYKKIPKEVHEAYLDELYPDRHKPIDWEYKGDKSKGILATIREQQPYTGKVTKQDMIDFFEYPQKQREKERQETQRQKAIWDKHYKKYKLEYRK